MITVDASAAEIEELMRPIREAEARDHTVGLSVFVEATLRVYLRIKQPCRQRCECFSVPTASLSQPLPPVRSWASEKSHAI